MLLKRLLALVVSVLLFILFWAAYLHVTHSQMEDRFHQERAKYGVEGTVLTAAAGPLYVSSPTPVTSPASPTPASATPAPAPAPAPDGTDTNLLIGPPLPPDSTPSDNMSAPSGNPSTPDSTPIPPAAPTAPDSTPPPPPSGYYSPPRSHGAPFLILADYRPSADRQIEFAEIAPASNAVPATNATATPATPAAATNATLSPSPAPTAAATTPAATNTVTTPAKPVAVQASVIVLLYHQFRAAGTPNNNPWNMPADVFESEMKYIKDNGYHVVPLSDVLRFVKHQIGLPPGSVAITIDDGYKSAIVYAAPVLKKYNYPWTYFIYPDFITVNEGKGAASWNDLLALQAQGVDIECHSMTHPQLPKHRQKIKGVWHDLSPAEYDQWLTDETAGSKALLEQKMGKKITCFAYPYGAYNKEVEAKTIAAGFEAIFTVADNPIRPTTDPFSMGRYTITQEVEKNFPAYLRQGALGLDAADPAPGATISDPRPVITATLGYAGTFDPNSIETSVRDFGDVRHDFDPKTNTVRLYLPRDLIQPVNLVNIRVKDAQTGQVLVANWHFNYEPPAPPATPVHPPIPAATNAPAAHAPPVVSTTTNAPPVVFTTTNAPATADPAPKAAIGSAPNLSPH